jgi:hypothetical protein
MASLSSRTKLKRGYRKKRKSEKLPSKQISLYSFLGFHGTVASDGYARDCFFSFYTESCTSKPYKMYTAAKAQLVVLKAQPQLAISPDVHVNSCNIPTFVPTKAIVDKWVSPKAGTEIANIPFFPRCGIIGNSSAVDEIFSIVRRPEHLRGRLSVVLLTGPSGCGKTVSIVSACHLNNRRCVLIDGSNLPSPGSSGSSICSALDHILRPVRGRVVIIRSVDGLSEDQTVHVSQYIIRNIFATPRRHNLLILCAGSTANPLFKQLKRDQSFLESKVMISIYMHQPTSQQSYEAIAYWEDAKMGKCQNKDRCVEIAGGDLRKLYNIFSQVNHFVGKCDMSHNPYTLASMLLGGTTGQVERVDRSKPDQVERIGKSISGVHSDVVDILHENYLSVLGRPGLKVSEDVHYLADMLSIMDMMDKWVGGELRDDQASLITSLLIYTTSDSALDFKPFHVGARRSKIHEQRLLTEERYRLELSQRLEMRTSWQGHHNTTKLQDSTTPLTAAQVLDWPVCTQRF